MQDRMRSRAQAMGQAPIWKLLVRFSGPAIVSMVVAASYTIVDAIFVGRLGPEALGALTGLWIAFPVADALSVLLTLIWTSVEFRRQGIRFRLQYG
jgi:Na+-driven multidrug efflux pump